MAGAAGVDTNLTDKLGGDTAQNGAANDPTAIPADLADGNIPTTVIGTMIIEELITTFAVENGTEELGTDEIDVIDHSPWKTALVAVVLSLIIILTIGGNVLVVLSPIVSKRLRTVTYTFLVSLASADLLLGITVLPWSAIYTISSEWPFSVVFCNIYVSCDVMFCTSSILHLLVISLERYFAITRPYAYQRKMSHKKAWIAIVVVWVVSLGVSFLPLHLGWNTADGSVQNYDHPSQCVLTWNMAYALFDGIVLFYFPLILMCFVYARIMSIAYRQAKSIKSMMVAPAPSITRGTNQEKHENTNNNHKGVVDEHKAVKIIAVVMGSFVVCWVPYFTMFTFGPLFNWNISDLFYLIVLWLGYFNSLINPLVYACMNREFRRAFKTILSCARWNRSCIGSFGSHDSQIKQANLNHQTNTRHNGSVVTYTTRDTLSTDTQSSIESKRHSDLYLKLVKTQEDIAEDSDENRQSESISDQNHEKQRNGPSVLDVEMGNPQYDHEQQQEESSPTNNIELENKESSPTNNAELEDNDHLKERELSSEQKSEEPEPLEELYISESTDFKEPERQQELPVINGQGEDPVLNGKGEDPLTEPEQELTTLENTTKQDDRDSSSEKTPLQNTTKEVVIDRDSSSVKIPIDEEQHLLDRDSSSEKIPMIDEDQHLLEDEEEVSSETIESPTNDIQLKTLHSPQNREIIVDVP